MWVTDRPIVRKSEKNQPIQGITERYIQLSAVKYVDEIVPYAYEKELLDILDTYPIDIRIIGEEYPFLKNNSLVKMNVN